MDYTIFAWWALIFILYFIFFGASASYLAAQRGRKEWGWFFAGAFLGPLAIIVIGLSTDLDFEKKITAAVMKALDKDAPKND
ncbi:MAG: hypothetical protein P9M03_05480 [Candidatus Theseobacter exili]|nr:hypothetical protein [Candidatus Theseobacter exili]